jgi:hypothetical protein
LDVPVPPINNILGKLLDQNGIKITNKEAQPGAVPQNKRTEGTGIG